MINEGENSTNYWLTVFTMSGGLEIRCELVTPVEGYYEVSYYTGNTQKPFKSDAVKLTEMISGSDYNITLVESKKVTGEVTLPDVMPVERDTSIIINFIARSETIIVCDGDPYFNTYFSKDVNAVIKKGEKSAQFELELPAYSEDYYYNYTLNDYISGVSPNSDISDLNNKLTEGESLNIVLEKGNVIRGEIRLPEDEVAGKGGFPVTISAIYYTKHYTIQGQIELANFIDKEVIIPEGENGVGYEVTVYPQYSKYYIQYRLNKNTEEYRGYYSKSGTVTMFDKEECAITVTKDVNDIDLDLLDGQKIPEALYGDVNNDGEVDAIDLAKFRGYLLGIYGKDEITIKNTDLNLDEEIDSLDFGLLRKYLLGMIHELPVVSTPTYSYNTYLNYDFNNNRLGEWTLSTTNGGKADYVAENGKLKLSVQDGGNDMWAVSLDHKIPSLSAGRNYIIEFKIMSTKDANVYSKIGESHEPYRYVWANNWSKITLPANEVVSLRQSFTPDDTYFDEEISFYFGGQLAGEVPYEVFIDDVVIMGY